MARILPDRVGDIRRGAKDDLLRLSQAIATEVLSSAGLSSIESDPRVAKNIMYRIQSFIAAHMGLEKPTLDNFGL